MNWVRIDNRLIHGQIVEAWLPYTGGRSIIVANDDLAEDEMQQQIMSLAVPSRITCQFFKLSDLAGLTEEPASSYIVLFSNCMDAKSAYTQGFRFSALNIGNIHYSPGKKQIAPNVAVTEEDEGCLRFFAEHGVVLDFRCVPNEAVQVRL